MSKDADNIDTDIIRALAGILKETELSEIEVHQGDLKIRVVRTLTAAPVTTYAAAPAGAAAGPAPAAAEPPPEAPGEEVKSPMVGTVYLQSQPGARPFVRAGEQVTAGQTLLIIEAMKTMNPIPSPRAGTVLQVLVDDAQPVEFGEPLVILE